MSNKPGEESPKTTQLDFSLRAIWPALVPAVVLILFVLVLAYLNR